MKANKWLCLRLRSLYKGREKVLVIPLTPIIQIPVETLRSPSTVLKEHIVLQCVTHLKIATCLGWYNTPTPRGDFAPLG